MSGQPTDKPSALLDRLERPTTQMLFELWTAWRAAFDEEGRAWTAWRTGEGSYETFAAALDGEEAAAAVLAFQYRQMAADRGDAESSA